MRPALRLAALERALSWSEQHIALLDRVRPVGLRAEQQRLMERWAAGRREPARLGYAAAPSLEPLRERLARIAHEVHAFGAVGGLYAARAEELRLEARLVQRRGTPEFARLAAQRYRAEPSAADALATAERWAALAPEALAPRFRSDDGAAPESLLRQIEQRLAEVGAPYRVELRAELSSVAAVGDGVVRLRAGAWLTAEEARRVAAHEVLGHVLPRLRAGRERWPLWAAGSASGVEAEEGRALLLEERLGLMDDARRRQLGLRHLLALATREGATFVELVDVALRLEAPLEQALALALRVQRGGGLAREIVYLPALLTARRVRAEEPQLEVWLARGRYSVAAARVLRGLSDKPLALEAGAP